MFIRDILNAKDEIAWLDLEVRFSTSLAHVAPRSKQIAIRLLLSWLDLS